MTDELKKILSDVKLKILWSSHSTLLEETVDIDNLEVIYQGVNDYHECSVAIYDTEELNLGYKIDALLRGYDNVELTLEFPDQKQYPKYRGHPFSLEIIMASEGDMLFKIIKIGCLTIPHEIWNKPEKPSLFPVEIANLGPVNHFLDNHNIENLTNTLHEYVKEYGDEIFFSTNSKVCDEWEDTNVYTLSINRIETMKDANKRLVFEHHKNKEKKRIKNRRQEKKERDEYERLKSKYGD